MIEATEILVSLLNDGVDVWRPILARRVRSDIFRIVDQPYDREIEKWQFEPGDLVVCEMIDSSDGLILAATGLAKS